METKDFTGQVVEVKQEDRNGVPIGFISGYIATFDIDRGNDKFLKGAFLDSIAEHKLKNRKIRFKDHHGRTVGGFPIEGVYEDHKGLFGTAEVNLNVQQGREAYSLALTKDLSDFSIGFSSLEDRFNDGVREIEKAKIWEGSIVDEPMNETANVVEIKAYTIEEVKEMTIRDVEKAIRNSGVFSKSASAYIISKLNLAEEKLYTLEEAELIINLQSIKDSL
jgi:HK97 family phage prohead protease